MKNNNYSWFSVFRREGSSLVIAGASKAIEQLLNDILPTQVCTFIDNIQLINTSDTVPSDTASGTVADAASDIVPDAVSADRASDTVSDTAFDTASDTASDTVPKDRASVTVADTAFDTASSTVSDTVPVDKASDTVSVTVAATVASTAHYAASGKYDLKISSSVIQNNQVNLNSENSPFSDLELENDLFKSIRVISKPENSKSLENEVIASEISPKVSSSQPVENICESAVLESAHLESAELEFKKFSELGSNRSILVTHYSELITDCSELITKCSESVTNYVG